jgi:hypothetical protein
VEFSGVAPIRKAYVDAESVGQASACLVLNFDDYTHDDRSDFSLARYRVDPRLRHKNQKQTG